MERSASRSAMEGGRTLAVVVGIALMGLATAGQANAQQVDTRWLPWLGCWQAVGANPGQDMLVCVAPAEDGVEVATLTEGDIASSRILIADGRQHPITVEACSGWQSADFSTDGRRVFLRSEMICDTGEKRTSSAIMAMTAPSFWVDAQSVGLGDETMARVVRYRPASAPVTRSAGFAIPNERLAAVADARLLATADLSLADVEEAGSRVEEGAVVAFLIERDQTFELNAERLLALADAGVSREIIDVLVAVSYPDRFAIDRDDARPEARPEEFEEDRRVDRYGYDPFGWGYGYGCSPGYWSSYCSPYRYSRYGLGYGGGYYDPYWGYGWGYTTRPMIVVVDGDDGGSPGRVVSGQGYTRGGSSSSTGRQARPSSSSGSRPASTVTTGGSRTGGASAGGYTRGGSSGSSSSGRTATKKGGGG